MTPEPSWLKPMLDKRDARAICILSELLEAGLRTGQCSANDITVRLRTDEHNVVGGVFKKLRGCGFVQSDRRIAPAKEKSHGRRVYVWELHNHTRARQILQRMAGVLVEVRDPAQGELF